MITDACPGRDREYIRLMSTFTQTAPPVALLLHFVPSVLQPLAGSLVRSIRWKLYRRKLMDKLVPLVLEHMDPDKRAKGPSSTFLTWCLDDQSKHKDPANTGIDPFAIADVMIQMNLAATGSTIVVATKVLYHILAFHQAESLMADVRQEFSNIEGGRDCSKALTWSDLEDMPLLDSVIRETMRISPLLATALERTVLKNICSPSGLSLAVGTSICVSAVSANHNTEDYTNPTVFDPYHFVQRSESAAVPTKSFVSFSYGVHVSSLTLLGIRVDPVAASLQTWF